MPRLALALTALLALLAWPASSAAQAPESDPSADSPSGHVYELGLDAAREDAAPRGYAPGSGRDRDTTGSPAQPPPASTPGDAPPAGAAEETQAPEQGGRVSAIRSENGFGSSTRVLGSPVVDAGAAEETQAPEQGGRVSAIRSENGFGSSTRVPGVDDRRAEDGRAAAAPPRLATAGASDPSGTRVYLVLALGVLLAAGVGIASRSARRAR